MKVTKSMVTSFKFCPYKFKLQYIDGVVMPTTPALTVGTQMHSFFETFFDEIGRVPIEQWEILIPDSFDYGQRSMAEFFIDQERFRYTELKDKSMFHPLHRELKMESKELMLKGYVDRVDWYKKDKGVTLVEYKTGQGHDLSALRVELSFYRILWDTLYGDEFGKVCKFLVINPRRGAYTYLKPTDSAMRAIYGWIDKVRVACGSGDFPQYYYPRKCEACKMCEWGEV